MKELEVSGVYKILCLVNRKFYIGSSKNINKRWHQHWSEKERAKTKNQMMYDDMRKYGKENFRIYVIYEGEDYKHIEKVVTYNLQPDYNIRNRTRKEPYRLRIKRWASRNEYMRYYYATHKEYQEHLKEYYQSENGKEHHRKAWKKYSDKLCFYNGEELTLNALTQRFRNVGVEHPCKEARKYII